MTRDSSAKPATAGPVPGRLTLQWALCALLAASTVAGFWPVIHCEFINFDDPMYVTQNRHVLAGLSRENIAWAFQTHDAGYWQPVTWLSFMLDVTLFGKNAAGMHVVNLIYHTANSILVFLLLNFLTGLRWRSFVVAALFAVHPLRVESVAWVCERRDVLSTFFGLLSLWAYACYVRRIPPGRPFPSSIFRSPSCGLYWLALICFALGLMSKPMLVTWPFVLLLIDFWPLQRCQFQASQAGRLFVEKIPFLLITVVFSGITFMAQKAVGAVAPLADLPLSARVANALVSYARYLGKVFWPVDLANPYPHPERWPVAPVLWAGALVAALCLLALWQARRRPFWFTGWFWFLGTLVPVIGLAQAGMQSMADRFTYVPLLGIFILLAWGGAELVLRLRISPKLAGIFVTLLIGACAARTRDQLQYWANTEVFFRRAVAVTRHNFIACSNLANHLAGLGRTDEAIAFYRQALDMVPRDPDMHNNLGIALAGRGDITEAVAHYEQALRAKPDDPNMHNNLGTALAQLKQFVEAAKHLQIAAAKLPDDADIHYNLGNVLLEQGSWAEAVVEYREVLRLEPKDAAANYKLGLCHVKLGERDRAREYFQATLQLNPAHAEAREQLQQLGAQKGNGRE